MAEWIGKDPLVINPKEEIPFSNVWCTGCEQATDRLNEVFGSVSYYCLKRGFRVPAYHPTVDCPDYSKKKE